MRRVGSLLPECAGGVVVDGLCPTCGKETAVNGDGTARAHENFGLVLWLLADSTIPYNALADKLGISWQAVQHHVRFYPQIREARRRDREARDLDREWASVWAGAQRALDEDLHCRNCGAWVIRYSAAFPPTCSSECTETWRVCGDCGFEGEGDQFAKVQGRRRNLCHSCNTKRAQEWSREHQGKHGVSVSHKVCPACQRDLPASKFYRMTSSQSGLQTYCKTCAPLLEEGLSVAEVAERHGVEYRRTRQVFA